MKSGRILLNAMMTLLLIFLSRTAWSSCSVYQYGYLTASFATKTFTVPKNKSAVTPIAIIPLSGSTTPGKTSYAYIACSGRNIYRYQRLVGGAGSSEYTGIYKTNLDGIGMKLIAPGGYVAGTTPNKWDYWYNSSPPCATCVLGATPYSYTLELYAIGPVTTGNVVFNGTYITGYGNDSDSLGSTMGYFNISGTVKFIAASCTTPNITVNLGKHTAADFSIVGSGSAPVPFNFEINDCDPGLNSVSYTFKPASGVTLQGSGNNQYLTLDGSSTASGVGVQMLYEDGITAVPFNSKTAFLGYNTTTGGSYTIPMKARYVRTGAISAGTANSAAEFVMAYE